MSDCRRRIVVSNRLGLHARAAAKLVRLSGKFAARMELTNGDARADVKSILSLMTLSANQGSELELTVSGEDAEEATEAICTLFADKFDEDE